MSEARLNEIKSKLVRKKCQFCCQGGYTKATLLPNILKSQFGDKNANAHVEELEPSCNANKTKINEQLED